MRAGFPNRPIQGALFIKVYVEKILNHIPDAILVCHLPDGPTAYFKLSNVRRSKAIKVIIMLFIYSMPFTVFISLYHDENDE